MKTSPPRFRTPVSLLGILALSSGLSCAVAPSGGTEPAGRPAASSVTAGEAVRAAYAQYAKRDFAGAAAGYASVADSASAGANDQKLAHLGKALVYLSTDPEWRDLDEAAKSLQMAEGIDAGRSAVETDMLLDAMSSLIGAEKNNSELTVKVSNASRQIQSLQGERETLVAEQANLNEALEKLKALTIGN